MGTERRFSRFLAAAAATTALAGCGPQGIFDGGQGPAPPLHDQIRISLQGTNTQELTKDLAAKLARIARSCEIRQAYPDYRKPTDVFVFTKESTCTPTETTATPVQEITIGTTSVLIVSANMILVNPRGREANGIIHKACPVNSNQTFLFGEDAVSLLTTAEPCDPVKLQSK